MPWCTETVAEETVKADRGDPNQAHGIGRREAQEISRQREQDRRGARVAEIVNRRPHLGSEEITRHENIGNEKQQSKFHPGIAKLATTGHSRREDCQPLEMEQPFGGCQQEIKRREHTGRMPVPLLLKAIAPDFRRPFSSRVSGSSVRWQRGLGRCG